jgi:hypothetical protein
MEADLTFAHAVMDVINGFNELERQTMRAAILADPRLHCILPLYDMLYTDKVGELWYYDEDGNFSHTQQSRREGSKRLCTRDLQLMCCDGTHLQEAQGWARTRGDALRLLGLRVCTYMARR